MYMKALHALSLLIGMRKGVEGKRDTGEDLDLPRAITSSAVSSERNVILFPSQSQGCGVLDMILNQCHTDRFYDAPSLSYEMLGVSQNSGQGSVGRVGVGLIDKQPLLCP